MPPDTFCNVLSVPCIQYILPLPTLPYPTLTYHPLKVTQFTPHKDYHITSFVPPLTFNLIHFPSTSWLPSCLPCIPPPSAIYLHHSLLSSCLTSFLPILFILISTSFLRWHPKFFLYRSFPPIFLLLRATHKIQEVFPFLSLSLQEAGIVGCWAAQWTKQIDLERTGGDGNVRVCVEP